jgi:hypothetical protein
VYNGEEIDTVDWLAELFINGAPSVDEPNRMGSSKAPAQEVRL